MSMELSVQGARTYCYTGGKPHQAGQPTVVFLHGVLHDHSVWTLLARWCAHHGYGVLALDQPGHGRSAGTPLAAGSGSICSMVAGSFNASRPVMALAAAFPDGEMVSSTSAGLTSISTPLRLRSCRRITPRLAELSMVKSLVGGYAQKLARYQCSHCGFKAKQFYWQCPGCSQWESYAPRRTEELSVMNQG